MIQQAVSSAMLLFISSNYFRTELNGMTNIYGAKQLQESPVPKDTILIQMELLYFFLFISYLPLK